MTHNTDAGGSLLETSEEDWDKVLAVNAKGYFFGSKYLYGRFTGLHYPIGWTAPPTPPINQPTSHTTPTTGG